MVNINTDNENNKTAFGIEYSPAHGGLIYLRRRQVIFFAKPTFSGFVLDAGCGDGRYAPEITNRGAKHYIGIDLDPKSLKKAKTFNSSNKTNFIRCTLENFPFKQDSFNIVFCSEVIEHLTDPTKVFPEMSRTIKQKGTLLISVPSQPIPKFTFLLTMNKCGKSIRYFMDQKTHLREYACSSLRNLFESFATLQDRLGKCGFKTLFKSPAWTIGSPILSIVLEPVMVNPLKHKTSAKVLIFLDAFLSKVLKNFGTHTVFICEKIQI